MLDGADQVYLAIRTKSGPHVTPELFTTSSGQIVCLTSAKTLKARLLRRDPAVGLAAFGPTGTFAAAGTATVLDPAAPATVVGAGAPAMTAPLDVARFVRDNVAELTGAAFDALAGRLGRPLPPHRVLVTIEPTADWSAVAPTAGDAVVGWLTEDGAPLALPAQWDADAGIATVRTALFEACGAAARSPACVTVDSWSGYGPSGKRGLMLRGDGIARTEDGVTRLELDARRATHWDGVETGTTDL